MINVKPDGNFNTLGGKSVHDTDSAEYREYRKCWSDYPKQFILRDFPMHLDIEITNRCNLRCTFCDRQPLVDKKNIGDMDIKLYKRIVDEGSEHRLWGVKLSYRGEPLLHKDVFNMVSYAKKKGIIDVYFNTNGMLLNEDAAKKIIDSGLNRISVSIEGTRPDVYEKMRINAKFNTVLENVENLISLRKKLGSDYPKIRVQSVNYPGFDIEEYKRFWIERCDEVAMLDYTDMSRRTNGLASDWACPQLWQRMTIEWDGSIFPCNNDDMRLLTPGNVKERPVHDCWHDLRVEEVRKIHKVGHSHKVKDCDGCPWRTAQIEKARDMGRKA